MDDSDGKGKDRNKRKSDAPKKLPPRPKSPDYKRFDFNPDDMRKRKRSPTPPGAISRREQRKYTMLTFVDCKGPIKHYLVVLGDEYRSVVPVTIFMLAGTRKSKVWYPAWFLSFNAEVPPREQKNVVTLEDPDPLPSPNWDLYSVRIPSFSLSSTLLHILYRSINYIIVL